jgi:hypothetical protein
MSILPFLICLACKGLLILLSVAHLPGMAFGGNLVWLETERFDDDGGWVTDSQFMDQMGSPYLMAIGLGKPVRDAVTTVTLPRAGRYRIWARTKDWAPKHHPGRFRIVLDGRPIDPVFGQCGEPGWRWEDGGVHELSGRCELRLRDMTGYYGRCDVIVLSDDPDWTPPAGKEAVAELREQSGGVSRQVEDMGTCDVVVVGGGLAGCMAAVSSARMGARTVLIQNRPVLGGNASVEILVPPVGVWTGPGVGLGPHSKLGPFDPRETGLIEEVRTKGNQTTDEAKVYSGRLARLVTGEPNLDLHLNTHATGVEMNSTGIIAAVLAVDVRSGRRMRFGGRIFIDCTGDGVIGVAAGAEYRHGKEPRSMYNESLAPEQGSRQTMGNSLKYVSQPTDEPQPFVAPSWAMKFDICDAFTPGCHPRLGSGIGWQWKIELGGTRDTYAEAEEIRDDLLRLIYGIWDHVKNHCPEHRQKAANHKLVWVGHVAGKRENRRLIGDYVLNQNDIGEQTLFPDRVAYSAWGIDDHHSKGFFHGKEPAGRHGYKGLRHSIPYRSLYSKNIDNLLMAGRNISASHVALAATRVMLTCAVIGQASGTAAGMCVERDTTPRGIHRDSMDQLQQQLLKDGARLIDLPNRDPRDLAWTSVVSASSEKSQAGDEVMSARNVINGYARASGERTNAWRPDPTRPLPQWIELAWDQPRTFNMVHVTFLTSNHAPARFAVQAWRDGDWKTLAEAPTGRFRRHVLGLDRTTAPKLRVVLLEAKPDEPGICEVRVYDEPQRLVEIARRAATNMNRPDSPPDLPWDDSVVEITGIDPKNLPGIVIDATEAEATGNWVLSDFSGRFILRGCLHDSNTQKGTKWLRFTPNVPRTGEYELRIAYVAASNRATNTPVTVRTPHGVKTIRINQQAAPPIDRLFYSLGTFHLEQGKSTRIEVATDGTDGYVVVDAIQLLPPGTANR